VSRGAKIALAIAGIALVALVAIVTLVFVMVDHVDDGTHAATKRVTPDRIERFDTIVVLPEEATTFAVSDIEERMNRLDAVDEYAEISNETLAYLVGVDNPTDEELLQRACARSAPRAYAVALGEPESASRRQVENALDDDALVRAADSEPPQTEIFMQVKATNAQTKAVADRLAADPDVAEFDFITHAEAYQEFRKLFADQPVLVESEPDDGSGLPESFRLTLRDGASPQTVGGRYENLSGVDTVSLPARTGAIPPASLFDPCEPD
jgi:hypothetical protein